MSDFDSYFTDLYELIAVVYAADGITALGSYSFRIKKDKQGLSYLINFEYKGRDKLSPLNMEWERNIW